MAQNNQMEAAGHSLGHSLGLGSHRLPPHPHSLPEFGHGLINPAHLTSPGSGNSVSNAAAAMRAREVREARDSLEGGSRLQRSTSGAGSFGGDTSVLDHGSGGRTCFLTVHAFGVFHCLPT